MITVPPTLKVKRLYPDAKLPTRATDGSAGLDLYAAVRCVLRAGETQAIPLGIAVAIPSGYVGLLTIRSGLVQRTGLSIVNTPGIIDSDYRGELMGLFRAPRPKPSTDFTAPICIDAGDRIAQLVIVPCPYMELIEVDELSETARGTGGFGSTGT